MSEDNFYSGEDTFGQKEQKIDIYQEGVSQQQGEYAQNMYQRYYQEPEEPEKPVNQAFGIASLVIGIISLLCFCTCINIPLAVVAIIFGIVQLAKKGSSKGMAIAGIITSALSIILFVVMIVISMNSIDFKDTFNEAFKEGFEEGYDFGEEFEKELEEAFEDDGTF